MASLVAQWWRIHLPLQDTGDQSLDQEDPWRRKRQPTPVFLPGKSHGQRSLAGYSPWDLKESDTTEQLTNMHSFQPWSVGWRAMRQGCNVAEERPIEDGNRPGNQACIFMEPSTDEALWLCQAAHAWSFCKGVGILCPTLQYFRLLLLP